jgi:aryl-alcohol dehydrogenase-like predicted oxidoreductase
MAMSISVSKLGLAAAQFGLDGGSSSAPRGRSPEAEARDILNIAARARLSVLDASGLFARAETLVGDLIPRPTPFRVCLAAARADRGADFVETEACAVWASNAPTPSLSTRRRSSAVPMVRRYGTVCIG